MHDLAEDFSNGLAKVRQNGKSGFIDKSGNKVIPCIYDWVEDFNDGLLLVKLNGKYGFIDKSNKQIVPIAYNDLFYFLPLGIIKAIVKDENGNNITYYYDTTGKYLGSD